MHQIRKHFYYLLIGLTFLQSCSNQFEVLQSIAAIPTAIVIIPIWGALQIFTLERDLECFRQWRLKNQIKAKNYFVERKFRILTDCNLFLKYHSLKQTFIVCVFEDMEVT